MFPLDVRLRNRCGNAEEGPHPMRTFLISWVGALALFTVLDGSTLRQRTADTETTPSRSLGAGVVVQMRENAGLALIRPVEASALVAGARPRLGMSIDA